MYVHLFLAKSISFFTFCVVSKHRAKKGEPSLQLELGLETETAIMRVRCLDRNGGSHGNDHGGDWALVWRYIFTAYSRFMSGRSAVAPRPSWAARKANTNASVCNSSDNRNALRVMNFALWCTIGKEFLIKNIINNWIACKEGTGRLV